MPAADPMSRGPRRNFKQLANGDSNRETKQVALADIIHADELMSVLDDLIASGHALTVGRTKDGGSIALAFMIGGRPIKRYAPTREKWLEVLGELQD